jgi:hypothetical protein
MSKKALTASDVPFATNKQDHWLADGPREFQRLGEGWYRWTVLGPGIQFEIDRLRLEKSQWVGELTVRCDLAGARTIAGELPPADFNLSSVTARQQRAKYLAERANTKPEDIDWLRLIEEFCLLVLQRERTGEPAARLCEFPEPTADQEFEIDGFHLLKDEPTILFGDGGSLKSMLALHFLGVLAERGIPTLFCDWEFSIGQHRSRLGKLFGAQMPRELYYIRCHRPIAAEADRIRRIIREKQIGYMAIDSVAYACSGAPESSEATTEFQRAARSLGVGSLWTAHVNRSETGDQKPFGSSFWHNSGRSIWNIQRMNESSVGSMTTVALYHRKSNTSGLRPAVGYEIDFQPSGTAIKRVDVAEIPEAAAKLRVADRIRTVVKRGPKPITDIATALDVDPDTIRKTVSRNTRQFKYYDDASGNKVVALLDWRHKK